MKYQDQLNFTTLEKYAASLNARARQCGAKGRLDASRLRDRILESGGRCEWCAADLVGSEFELDHVLSLNQRGSNTSVNLVVACPECNRRKAKKHPARFAAEIYSETGTKTTLVSRILQAGDVMARRQMGIFDAEESPAGQRVKIEDDLHQVPPYNWTD